MTKIAITFDDGTTHAVELSRHATELTRFSFNPSGLPAVHVIKALSSALVTVIEEQTLS
jgi:hypothetical protein